MQGDVEAFGVAQRSDVAPGGDQRGLDRIVGLIRVAEDPEGDRHARVANESGESVECLDVALHRPIHQGSLQPPLPSRVPPPRLIGLESPLGS